LINTQRHGFAYDYQFEQNKPTIEFVDVKLSEGKFFISALLVLLNSECCLGSNLASQSSVLIYHQSINQSLFCIIQSYKTCTCSCSL